MPNRPLLPLLFLNLACTCVLAQTDSLATITAPVTTVEAFGYRESDFIPAATTRLPPEEVRRYDQSSLVSALNRLPGVRFEERATGSYRVAIRGASLRSPFGVRNTQVYWNGIPYGEPGGDVPLNFLDAVNIDGVEVLRGPSGGFYGPGTAGTLLLNTDLDRRNEPFEISLTGGSYNYLRAAAVLTSSDSTRQARQLRLGYQRTDGYRDHSALERFTAQVSRRFGTSRNRTTLHALYTDLSYELPGGLNADQFAENPRQARPGSAEKNASIHYHNLLLGATNERYLGRWKLESSLYATGFYFDHPFNFDYKRETNLGAGGRLALRRLLRDDLDLAFGTELRNQLRFGSNFTNPDGSRPGDLNFSDEIFSGEQLVFTQLRYQPGEWDFTLGLSSSRLRYDVDRTFDADGAPGTTEFSADRPLSLRLVAGRRIGSRHYLYTSRADGFSPPTLDEFRTNEGSLNQDLKPEIGVNYELGYRYNYEGISLNTTAFYFRLSEAINSFADERGTQLFRNSGATSQAGLELSAQYRYTRPADWNLWLFGGYTYYDFTYDELVRDGEDFSGQTIPGAAPHNVNLEAVWSYRQRLEVSLLHNYVSEIPLNDANDVSAEAYHLVRAAVSYRLGRFTVFANGANLLNERMSFGNDLNPRFGGRYFQPAPGRNWQLGLRYGG